MNNGQYFSRLKKFQELLLTTFLGDIPTIVGGVKLHNFRYRTIFARIVSSVSVQNGVEIDGKELLNSNLPATKVDETLSSKTKVLDLAIKTKKSNLTLLGLLLAKQGF